MGMVAVGSLLLIEREFGKFDKAIRHATSVSETTGAEFTKMSEMALDASVRWNKAATDTAQAFYFLGSAGLTVTEQMQAFNDTVMLSRAMGSELAMTVEGLVDITRGFGLEFANTREIADQLTKTVISSNQVFGDLDQALTYGAASARQANNTLAETSAMLGIMANAGIKGSMAGTVLRRAMTNLMSPTGEMAGLVYELGLEVYDAGGKMKPFINIIGEISDKIKNSTDEYKNMVFEVLFGRRAISGQIQLFNYGADALRRYANEIKNAGGTTERVAGKQMKAFTEVLGQLWQEMKRVAITAGELMAPAIERVANILRDRMGAIREYIKDNAAAMVQTMKWVLTIGLLLAVGTPLLLVITNLAAQMVVLAGVIANPFVALIAVLYTLRAVWKQNTDEMIANMQRIRETIDAKAYRNFKYGMVVAGAGMGAFALSELGLPGIIGGGIAGGIAGYSEMMRGKKAYEKFRLGQFAGGGSGGMPDIGAMVKQAFGDALTAVRTQLSEDTGDIVEKLKAANPFIAGIIKKSEDAVANIKTMFGLFMKEPGTGFSAMADDMELFNARLREGRSRIGQTNSDVATMGKRVGYLAGEWDKAIRMTFAPPSGTGKSWMDAFVSGMQSVQTAWSDTINSFITEGGSLKDFLEDMFLGILTSFNRMIADIAASDLMYRLLGKGVSRLPGTPGIMDIIHSLNPTPAYYTPGLSTPSGSILPGAGKSAGVVINLTNNGTPVNMRVTGQHFDGKQYIVSAVMEEYNTNPNFRNALGR